MSDIYQEEFLRKFVPSGRLYVSIFGESQDMNISAEIVHVDTDTDIKKPD